MVAIRVRPLPPTRVASSSRCYRECSSGRHTLTARRRHLQAFSTTRVTASAAALSAGAGSAADTPFNTHTQTTTTAVTSTEPIRQPIYRLSGSTPRRTSLNDKVPGQGYFDPSSGDGGQDKGPGPGLGRGSGPQGRPPDDENRTNLGKTLRILQDRLPTLLQSPLQQDLLAPNISLHLFPSTHPHLPAVSGRVAYTAALWSSPIAWNRIPVIGNVRLNIQSARMTKEPVPGAPLRHGAVAEQLVVRWCTADGPGEGRRHFYLPGKDESPVSAQRGMDKGAGEAGARAGSDKGRTSTAAADGAQNAAGSGKEKKEKHFAGLFIFQFDKQGRILSHTIETVQGGGDWERGVGAKVVGLTDWLLGGLGRGEPCPAFRRLDDGNGEYRHGEGGRRGPRGR